MSYQLVKQFCAITSKGSATLSMSMQVNRKSISQTIFNTAFYFYSGVHRLDNRLRFKNVHNVIPFQGLPTDIEVVNIKMALSASITWENSWNVEISSIKFLLIDNFTYI